MIYKPLIWKTQLTCIGMFWKSNSLYEHKIFKKNGKYEIVDSSMVFETLEEAQNKVKKIHEESLSDWV